MRISDWSSDVCSSDLLRGANLGDANLRNVDLSKAIVDNTNLMGAIHRDTEASLPEEIERVLRLHSVWIASNGRQGMRAEFVGRALRGLHFSSCAVRGVTFEASDLTGTAFVRSALLLTSFRRPPLAGPAFPPPR